MVISETHITTIFPRWFLGSPEDNESVEKSIPISENQLSFNFQHSSSVRDLVKQGLGEEAFNRFMGTTE